MMSGARNAKLGDVADVLYGFAFKSRRFTEDPEDVPLVKGSNLGHREIRWSEGPWWPRSELDDHEKYKLRVGDVVLAMDRPIVGGNLKYSWLSEWEPEALLVQRVCRLRAADGLDQTFLRYVIGSPDFRAHVERITTGVNVPHISGGDIKSFKFVLPNLPIQRRIADILSAYDDLIENNNRRMALLEESIHLLYREWFVYLRFPGHERAEVLDGVPEGWSTKAISDVAAVNSETLSPKQAPDEIRYVAIKDVSTGSIDAWSDLPFSEAPSRARRLVRDGDVIWSTVRPGNRAYAVVVSPVENMVVSTGFAVLRPVGVGRGFLYGVTTYDGFVEHMKAIAQGAAYPAVKAKDFEDFELVVPAEPVLAEFESIVGPSLETIYTLRLQNEKLREARDLLLPRLMDGRIPV